MAKKMPRCSFGVPHGKRYPIIVGGILWSQLRHEGCRWGGPGRARLLEWDRNGSLDGQ